MSWPRRAARVAAFALATALLLASLARVHDWQSLGRPLERLLAGRPEVLSYRVAERDGVAEVTVTLADVPNLRETYLQLESALAAELDRPFRLRVEGRPDARLQADLYALHYHVFDALARGGFADAARRLQDEGRRRGLDRVGFYVDERFAYLQLHRGDRYLYAVWPRAAGGEVAAP